MGAELSNWDRKFLDLANFVAAWSKDPSTKTGAVIVRENQTVVAIGYNGFPRGIADNDRLQDRPKKYELVVHCEVNALLDANQDVKGCTLYVSYPPCCRCAVAIIQSGITRVVAGKAPQDYFHRWGNSCFAAVAAFHEAGVTIDLEGDGGGFL